MRGEAPFTLDTGRQMALSAFARCTRIALPELVELIRGQTTSDYRPNKALNPADIKTFCGDYKGLEAVLDVVQHGVRVPLRSAIKRQSHRLENHQSARDRLRVLRKNVRQEQDAGRCIVVDLDLLDQWPEVIISPYGVVDKASADQLTDGRTIQNLSFPPGRSVNDATDKDAVPTPDYRPVETVALEILRLRESCPDSTIYLLAGDVALAFRHVHLHSTSVRLDDGRCGRRMRVPVSSSDVGAHARHGSSSV